MRIRRSPRQIVVLTVAVAIGLYLGVALVGRRSAADGSARERAAWPDVTLEDVASGELALHGFRLTGSEPKSWSHISVRLYQDARGTVNLVRCLIDPVEVATLVAFPPGSHRPARDTPPADWPRGAVDDPMRVPDWWDPRGGQSRIYERVDGGGRGIGIFANYDPATQVLCFWHWQRSDWRVQRAEAGLMVDELAAAIGNQLRASGHPWDAAGWFHAVGLEPGACGLPAGRMPAAITRIDVALLPLTGRHRYLLAVHGVDQSAGLSLVADAPLRALAADGAPPLRTWGFAGLTAGAGTPPLLPAWFAPGPGPRWAHCLIALGDGRVEQGRWVAYDPLARTLFVWDWEGPVAQSSAADLCPVPEAPKR